MQSDHPIYRLLGSTPSTPTFHDTLRSLLLPPSAPAETPLPSPTIATFSDAEYHSYKDHGISLCFNPTTKLLTTIHAYNISKSEGYKKYPHALPHGLRADMTAREVVSLLGEPKRKGGGGRSIAMWVEYPELGVQVDFAGKNWDEGETPVACIAFFQPEAQ
ncbi:hypothetical protein HK104_004818 [Borealophlyctis nickersoniae]|nr:hypothetical protein HK104_004818 [Borealophlyctis nickersoniae]